MNFTWVSLSGKEREAGWGIHRPGCDRSRAESTTQNSEMGGMVFLVLLEHNSSSNNNSNRVTK